MSQLAHELVKSGLATAKEKSLPINPQRGDVQHLGRQIEFEKIQDLGIIEFKTTAIRDHFKPFQLPSQRYAIGMIYPFGKDASLKVTVIGRQSVLSKLSSNSFVRAKASLVQKTFRSGGKIKVVYNLDLVLVPKKKPVDTEIKFLPQMNSYSQSELKRILRKRKLEGYGNILLPQGGYVSYKTK